MRNLTHAAVVKGGSNWGDKKRAAVEPHFEAWNAKQRADAMERNMPLVEMRDAGMSYDKISAATGLTRKAINNALDKTRRRLRDAPRNSS